MGKGVKINLPVIVYVTRPLSPISASCATKVCIASCSVFSGISINSWLSLNTGELSLMSVTLMMMVAMSCRDGLPLSCTYAENDRFLYN